MSAEGDGLIFDIYNDVWECIQRGHLTSLDIPETVLFDSGWPKVWFKRVGPKGHSHIERMPHDEISMAAIHASLVRRAEGEIIAELFYGRYDPHVKHFVLSVEYLDQAGLDVFFMTRGRGQACILQQFVYPKSRENVLIQGVWSTNGMLASLRRNVHSIAHSSFSVYDRCVTFDGPQHLSQWGVLTPYLKAKFFTAFTEFAQTLFEIEKRKKMCGLLAFFKIGRDNTIYLLRSTTVRYFTEGHDPAPVDLNVVFCQPQKPRTIIRTPVNVTRNMPRLRELGLGTLSSKLQRGVHSMDIDSVTTEDLKPLETHLQEIYATVAYDHYHSEDSEYAQHKKGGPNMLTVNDPMSSTGRSSFWGNTMNISSFGKYSDDATQSKARLPRTFSQINNGFTVNDAFVKQRNELFEFLKDAYYRSYWETVQSRGKVEFSFGFPRHLSDQMNWTEMKKALQMLGVVRNSSVKSDDSMFSFADALKVPQDETLRSAIVLLFPVLYSRTTHNKQKVSSPTAPPSGMTTPTVAPASATEDVLLPSNNNTAVTAPLSVSLLFLDAQGTRTSTDTTTQKEKVSPLASTTTVTKRRLSSSSAGTRHTADNDDDDDAFDTVITGTLTTPRVTGTVAFQPVPPLSSLRGLSITVTNPNQNADPSGSSSLAMLNEKNKASTARKKSNGFRFGTNHKSPNTARTEGGEYQYQNMWKLASAFPPLEDIAVLKERTTTSSAEKKKRKDNKKRASVSAGVLKAGFEEGMDQGPPVYFPPEMQ
eukprot:PhF_6_TR31463/c0_g1_i1/m.46187